jgi:nucleotide-binding universal stress UspA family protein
MTHIVVGVDGSSHAERALRWAVKEAELRGAELEVVHGYVVHPHAGVLVHDRRVPAQATLDGILERNQSLLGRVKWTAALVPLLWSPSDVLAVPAGRTDLVVVGSRGLGGFGELLLGSTSYRTAAHASTPVAVVPAGADEQLDGRRRIVVGVDDSAQAGRALRWALAEAEERGVALTAVHAYDPPGHWKLEETVSDDDLRRYRERLREEAVAAVDRALAAVEIPPDVEVERHAVVGAPAAVLLDIAGDDRLLVVGSHGRGGMARAVLGSVSHQCLHHAVGPVVVVP